MGARRLSKARLGPAVSGSGAARMENEMVRGLLIRQVLMAVNVLLIVVIGYIIFLVGLQQFGGPVKGGALDLSTDSPGDAIKISTIKDRSEYDSVVSGKLFGMAGTTATAVAETPPPSDIVTPTTFQGKLLATVASFPTDPLATAIIDNPSATTPAKSSAYYLGQMVTDSLKLAEVHRRQVILLNTATNKRESLKMEVYGSSTALAKNQLGTGLKGKVAAAGGEGANHVTLERKAVSEELASYDPVELIQTLNPQLVQDDKGNITGITSASLTSIPVAKQAGLRDNDVIQAVNGMALDSQEKIMEVAQKVGNSNTIRLSVLRDNKPQMITIKLQ